MQQQIRNRNEMSCVRACGMLCDIQYLSYVLVVDKICRIVQEWILHLLAWVPAYSTIHFVTIWNVVAMDDGGVELGYWPHGIVLPNRLQAGLAKNLTKYLSSPLADFFSQSYTLKCCHCLQHIRKESVECTIEKLDDTVGFNRFTGNEYVWNIQMLPDIDAF